MLVIQHIWHCWDKWTRGAERPERVLLDPAYSLPACEGTPAPQQEAFVHDVHTDMWEDRPRCEGCGVMKHDAWTSGSAVDWKLRGGKAEISVLDPSRWRRQTKWPGWLPTPLFVLNPGETARIHWNAYLLSGQRLGSIRYFSPVARFAYARTISGLSISARLIVAV